MPFNLFEDEFARKAERVSRCAFCFSLIKNARKNKSTIKRRFIFNGSTIEATLCDSRCAELWNKQMNKEHHRIEEFGKTRQLAMRQLTNSTASVKIS